MAAKVVWFTCLWGIRWDYFHDLDNVQSILVIVFNPDDRFKFLGANLSLFQLPIAIFMEQIWMVKNKMVFKGIMVNIDKIIFSTKKRIFEFFVLLQGDNHGPIGISHDKLDD